MSGPDSRTGRWSKGGWTTSGVKWTVGVLALWLAAAAFLLGPQAARWNDLATGILVALAGVWLATRAAQQGWIAAALGAGVVAAAPPAPARRLRHADPLQSPEASRRRTSGSAV